MARIWSENFNPARHHNRMAEFVGVPEKDYWKAPTLQQYPVYFVKAAGFTFEFHSVEQLRACFLYYNQKTRPSSRRVFSPDDRKIMWLHSVAQRWFEKLPMYLLEEKNRIEVAKILSDAVKRFDEKQIAVPKRRRTPRRGVPTV